MGLTTHRRPLTKCLQRRVLKKARVSALPGSQELRRDALLKRIERAQPKILALIAPAGFGKSTLARQLIIGKPAAVCDVAGVLDDLDLARRLVPALAQENPARTQLLTQRELMLGDGGTSIAERVNLALEAWKDQAPSSFFVFENAEHIARNPGAREFFARLLTHRPPGRTVVICSRENLRVHLTRYAPPHEILTLRADDLAFDSADLEHLFPHASPENGSVERILQLSQGWPIAVFLLKRFENEGRMNHLLESLDDIAFDELHDYLADQVLASLDQELVQGLFACACLTRATAADLYAALENEKAVRALAEFARESPFLAQNAQGEFELHPMLASLLLEHREEHRDELLARTAAYFEKNRKFQRAAELHLARGDRPAAARALGQHEVIRDHAPSMEYARVLSSLDRSLVQRYPRLWAVTALLRMFCVDTEELLDEAESLWRTLSPDVSTMERYYILVFRILFMSYMGLLGEAVELLEQFAAENGIGDEPKNYLEGYLLYLLGLMRARVGLLSRGERDLTVALPHVGGMDVTQSGTMLALGSDIARVRGEYTVARQFVDRALESAQKSGLHNFVAFDLAEGAFGAWISGDDASLTKYAVQLDEVVNRGSVRGFAYFAGVLRGRHEEPQDADLLKWVACGRIVAAANADERSTAIRHARAAVDAAVQYGAPFIECLAYLALAYFDLMQFEIHMSNAIAAAERCDSRPLWEAVGAASRRQTGTGMLTAILRRFERERSERVPMLEISLAEGSVRARGTHVTLSDREHALLTALCLRRETVPRGRLAALLWPELDDYAARNALSVCLHRLRGHLGTDEAIVRGQDGYALNEGARVDLWEFDRLTTTLRGRASLTAAELRDLCAAHEKLRMRRPDRMMQWEWFEPAERHLCELRLEVAHRLALDALANGGASAALEYAEEMIGYDPCDESARQIAIRAHLAIGDRGAALRHYRQYRDTLAAELQVEPSQEIKVLVGLP